MKIGLVQPDKAAILFADGVFDTKEIFKNPFSLYTRTPIVPPWLLREVAKTRVGEAAEYTFGA